MGFSIMVFSTYSCYFGHGCCYFGCPKPIIWQAWCLHFTTLGTILTAWGHPRGLGEQQEGHVGAGNQTFNDFGMIWGRNLESFLGLGALDYMFIGACFQVYF